MPYCGEISTSANVDCIGELIDALKMVGFDPRRTSTLRRCLATGLALHRYGLWSLRLPTPSATPLKKTESKRPVSICLVAGLLPWFGLRRPYGIHASGHARDDSGDAMDRNPLEHLPAV